MSQWMCRFSTWVSAKDRCNSGWRYLRMQPWHRQPLYLETSRHQTALAPLLQPSVSAAPSFLQPHYLLLRTRLRALLTYPLFHMPRNTWRHSIHTNRLKRTLTHTLCITSWALLPVGYHFPQCNSHNKQEMIDWGGLVDIFYLPSIPDVDTFQKVAPFPLWNGSLSFPHLKSLTLTGNDWLRRTGGYILLAKHPRRRYLSKGGGYLHCHYHWTNVSFLFKSLEQCCPTFLTQSFTQEINQEAMGHTSKLKSND